MYIRTKDGRILDFDKLNEVSKLSIDMAEELIREAKTIEELCDEFVVHRKDEGNYNFVWNEYERKTGLNYFCSSPKKYDVYGAIWVDGKGLIFVAKMNDKGDFELIWN